MPTARSLKAFSGSQCGKELSPRIEPHARLFPLDDAGELDWHEVFADGTFSSAKKWFRGRKDQTRKGAKLMVVADGAGVPLGVQLASASPHEVTLIESSLEKVSVPRRRGRPRKKPDRLIYDRAADCDALRARLKQRRIDLICPNPGNKRRKTQDGRKLRRYQRRWKIERTIAWLQDFRLVPISGN